MKLFIKFASRGRQDKFFETLDRYMDVSDNHDLYFLFSFNEDDEVMNNVEVKERLSNLFKDRDNMNYYTIYEDYTNKIEAINHLAYEFSEQVKPDIMIMGSDDLVPLMSGWDEVLVKEFEKVGIEDLDFALHTRNYQWETKLDINCIMGKKYFDRFGFFYNPEYKSIYSDNEYTFIAKKLNRWYWTEQVIMKHDHKMDETFARNSKYDKRDHDVWVKREVILDRIFNEDKPCIYV